MEQAISLLVAVEAERCAPLADRTTRATDEDLEKVAAVLHAALRLDRSDGRSRLAGVIARLVVDRWSLTSNLSNRLVEFDHRLSDAN